MESSSQVFDGEWRRNEARTLIMVCEFSYLSVLLVRSWEAQKHQAHKITIPLTSGGRKKPEGYFQMTKAYLKSGS